MTPEREIAETWRVLEDAGFPPEAAGCQFVGDMEGKLANAVHCAIDCLLNQREDLLKEVIELRAKCAQTRS